MSKLGVKQIFLDQETIFHHHISQDQDKLKIYNEALETRKITECIQD